MAGNQQPASVVLDYAAVLDAKPLRTLTPMFPAPLGMHTFTPKSSSSVVCVTPFGPYAGGTELGMPGGVPPMLTSPSASADPKQVQPYTVHMNGTSNANVPSAPPEVNNIVLQTPTSAVSQESGKRKRGRPKRVPDVSVLSTPVPVADGTPILQTPPASSVHESVTKKRGRRSKLVQDISDTSTPPVHSKESEPFMQTPAVTVLEDVDVDSGDTSKRGRPRKIDTSLLHLPSLFSDDPRESTDNILMMFDALRRRLMQLDEVKQVAKQQQNLKAGSIMMSAELRLSKNKRIGEVPGVEVGDMFYFRIEMCLVGLNSQSMAGIDYMSAKFGNEEDPVAISIVSAGVYEDAEDNDPDVLVYSGHGMSGKDDQKLEREDDYIFETPPSEQNLRWNYAPELLGEPSLSDLNESSKQLPIISAKIILGFLWLNNQPLRDTFLVEEAAYGGGGIMGVVFQPQLK
ncbi:hypothetical protein ZWY2020_040817 [Hordeum vulgare]|nr:hypothetical protein ZWY2020_040817 [Hordeum vulgare]